MAVVLCCALAINSRRRFHDAVGSSGRRVGRRAVGRSLWSALVTSVGGGCVDGCDSAVTRRPSVLAIHLAWIAAVWVLLAVLHVSPVVFTASQFAAVLAIVFGVVAAVESHAWYAESRQPWLDPWFLELVGIALAAYCCLLALRRWFVCAEPRCVTKSRDRY